MFGWFKKGQTPKEEVDAAFTLAPPGVAAGTTLLGPSLHISGKITGDDHIELLGRHEGTIDLRGDLTIQEGAMAGGSIAARSVVVCGSLEGDVRARRNLLVHSTARISGTIATPAARVEEGAFLEGKVEMDGPA